MLALYKGFLVNCMRDVPGWGSYFFTFELVKDIMFNATSQWEGNDESGRRRFIILNIAGGIAGQISWLIVYPLDVLKT